MDHGYIERREKRLQDLSILRQVSIAAAIIAFALTAATVVGIPQGGLTELVLAALTVGLWLVAMATFIMQRAQSAAEKVIQYEYEQLSAYQSEKPKRNITVRLTDEGELRDDDESAELDDQRAAHQLRR